MEDEEPSTPKKVKYGKRNQACKTPKKENKTQKALMYFGEPFTRLENGIKTTCYTCKLCNKVLNGNFMGNLSSHRLYKHEQIYEETMGPIQDSIEIKRLKLLQNCVSIVALGGRPFSSLNDHGFQQIIEKQLNQFSKAGIPLDLKHGHQPAVHSHLNESANQVRDAIKDAVKYQPLSIQIDIGTRLGCSILAIDAQFYANKNFNLVNIGMIELKKSHTSQNLSVVYRDCLKKYEISKQQVMSISGDNGRNVQKFIEIEKVDAQSQVARRLHFDTPANLNAPNVRNAAVIDQEIENVLNSEEMSDDDDVANILQIFEECGIDYNEENGYDQLLNDTITAITKEHGQELFNMSGISCAAHTLQLLVKDGIKELKKETSNIISLSRRIIKALKLNSTKQIIESAIQAASTELITSQLQLTLKVPSLDIETRWGSSFVMVRLMPNYVS